MKGLVDLHKAAQDAQRDAEASAAVFHRAVADALRDGTPATKIAEACGVTRARVYQWRDKAAR